MIFGKEENKGLRFNVEKFSLEVVTIGENGITEDDILIHDETNRHIAFMLSALESPEFPVVCGVIYCDPVESYDQAVHYQIEQAKQSKKADFNALLRAGRTWEVQ